MERPQSEMVVVVVVVVVAVAVVVVVVVVVAALIELDEVVEALKVPERGGNVGAGSRGGVKGPNSPDPELSITTSDT